MSYVKGCLVYLSYTTPYIENIKHFQMYLGLQTTCRDGNCFMSSCTSPAKSGKISGSHAHSPVSYPIFFHTLKIINTSECSWRYGPHTKMGIISYNKCVAPVPMQLSLDRSIRLTYPLPNELCKKVLSDFSPLLSHTL